jgi:hypothetical protein
MQMLSELQCKSPGCNFLRWVVPNIGIILQQGNEASQNLTGFRVRRGGGGGLGMHWIRPHLTNLRFVHTFHSLYIQYSGL